LISPTKFYPSPTPFLSFRLGIMIPLNVSVECGHENGWAFLVAGSYVCVLKESSIETSDVKSYFLSLCVGIARCRPQLVMWDP